MIKKKISQKEFDRGLKLTLIGGGAFTVWYSLCNPQPLFNVFFY